MNGVLILDKPPGCTSHDLTSRARRLLKEPRLGHLGTLDPLATGVLPLLAGEAARLADFALKDKVYEAVCRLDLLTDTDDVTGKPLQKVDAPPPDPARAAEAVKGLEAVTRQIPPMVSAVQVNGERLYDLARRGLTVERKPRPVSVYSAECLGVEGHRVRFRVSCSGGTYVRSLCRSLGETLGGGGCLEGLRRTQSGPFHIGDALAWKDLEEAVAAGRAVLKDPQSLVGHLPSLALDEKQEKEVRHGREVAVPAGLSNGWVRLLAKNGRLAAMAEVEGGKARPRKVFAEGGI